MIKQPKPVKFSKIQNGTGASFKLEWSPNFAKDKNDRLKAAQVVVDSEFLRYSLKKLPHQTGNFQQRTIIANAPLVGTGLVMYPGPFARPLYYGLVMEGVDSHSAWAKAGEKKVVREPKQELVFTGGPERGAFWAERTWKDDGPKIVQAAQRAFDGGGVK